MTACSACLPVWVVFFLGVDEGAVKLERVLQGSKDLRCSGVRPY